MYKLIKRSATIWAAIISGVLITGCEETVPTVTTTAVSGITQTAATSGGKVTNDGGTGVVSRGICYSVNPDPTTDMGKTNDGSGLGPFTSSLTGLMPGTTFYLRAYAVNSVGTAYGNELSFSTSPVLLATLTTAIITTFTGTTAVSGGNITSDGGGSVTSRGVCWATTHNPTTGNSKTNDGSGTGIFTSEISGLSHSTRYYVRAYAINKAGTAYGNEETFITREVKLATVITSDITSVTERTSVSGGDVTDDGGELGYVSRGICYSTKHNPTTSDHKIPKGGGLGSFTINIAGLNPSTAYYVRAYAENAAGTAYGAEKPFMTLRISNAGALNNTVIYDTVTDIESNVYRTLQIGSQTWFAENLRTRTFRDGTLIPTGIPSPNLNTIPGYCYTNGDENNLKYVYGAIYNWFAVNTSKLCPTGWHVSTDSEWTGLTNHLGGSDFAGDGLKEAGTLHWNNPNTGTNTSGFTALPGGPTCSTVQMSLVYTGLWWSSNNVELNEIMSWAWGMTYNLSKVTRAEWPKINGCFVRCVKD